MNKTLLVFLFSITVFAADNFTISVNTGDEFFSKLLRPVWQKIPSQINLNNVDLGQIADNVTGEITQGLVTLGENGKELLNVIPDTARNKLFLNWNLEDLNAVGELKIQFKYKKWGISFSHSEAITFSLQSLKKATTHVQLSLKDQEIDLVVLENMGFNVEKVSIETNENSSSILRWLFKNVISKEKLNKYVTEKLNLELVNLVNSPELLQRIKTEVDKKVDKLFANLIEVDELGSHFYLIPNRLILTKRRILFSSNLRFNYDKLMPHPCTEHLSTELRVLGDQTTGAVQADYETIEIIGNNFMTYGQINEKDQLIQPILCFGYDKFDSQGKPEGHLISLKLLLRNLQAKVWVKPQKYPELAYDLTANLISAKLNFELDIQGVGMPHLKRGNDPLVLSALAVFSFVVEESGGLSLKIESLKFLDVLGKLSVKWFAFTPYVNFSLKDNLEALEKEVKKLMDEQLTDGKFSLFEDGLELWEKFSVGVKSYDINETGHQFLLEVKQ